MSIVHFITYPEVVIDPSMPVTLWPLAPEGVRRMRLALNRPWMGDVCAVFSSAEREATDPARLVADRLGLSPVVVAELGENDRSATGYLPKVEFEVTADAFFAHLNPQATFLQDVPALKKRKLAIRNWRLS